MLNQNPGGLVPPQLYLTLDKLAGNMATRRCEPQLGRVSAAWDFEENLKSAIAAIIKKWVRR